MDRLLDNGIATIHHVFTTEECRGFIAAAERAGFSEATVDTADGPRRVAAIRNNSRLIVDDVALAADLWSRVRPHVPAFIDGRQAIGVNERVRYYRYEPGQAFAGHTDGIFRRENGEESRLTLMIYLNEEFIGGETTFASEIVTPRTGDGLIFRHDLLHEGAAVREGTKYVLRSDIMVNPVGRLSG